MIRIWSVRVQEGQRVQRDLSISRTRHHLGLPTAQFWSTQEWFWWRAQVHRDSNFVRRAPPKVLEEDCRAMYMKGSVP